jgi:ELWxxDGT repeat protein
MFLDSEGVPMLRSWQHFQRLAPMKMARANGKSRSQLPVQLTLESLEDRALLSVAPAGAPLLAASLVRVINPNQQGSFTPPSEAVNVNGTLFFSAPNAAGVLSLWKSDGTAAGTVLVKDAWPIHLLNVQGTLYFLSAASTRGFELWKSDGTTAGTVPVLPAGEGPAGLDNSTLTAVNGTVFFTAADGAHGPALWKSDGTAAGTVPVMDFKGPGQGPYDLTNVNGTLYFGAPDGKGGSGLWKSNGTAAGAVMVADVAPSNLTAAGGTAFFTVQQGIYPGYLWKSDGTSAGTSLVVDVAPSNMIGYNGKLFFTATTTANGTELWSSNGTRSGTSLFDSVNPGPASSTPDHLTVVNGTLFFTADDGTHGRELWKTNGTTAGTLLVKDINPGPQDSIPLYPTIYRNGWPYSAGQLTAVGSELFFSADDGVHGTQLWKSDGTATGTVLVADLNTTTGILTGTAPHLELSSFPTLLTDVTGTLFFAADDGLHGRQLWKLAGAAGPVRLTDINPVTVGSKPAGMTSVNGTVFFAADDGVHGDELWKTDGTAAGTVLVKDVNPGPAGSAPVDLTAGNGTLFFLADDGSAAIHPPTGQAGIKLWKSDGTTAGTVALASFFPVPDTPGELMPADFTALAGKLFFVAADGPNHVALWKSDGTAAGTTLVKDIGSPGEYTSVSDLTVVNGTLFFSGDDGVGGLELWKSDGTTAGTGMVADVNPGPASSSPANLTRVNGTLFFTAEVGSFSELWKSNGTAAGTVLVAQFSNTPGSPNLLTDLIAVNGTLFFGAGDVLFWGPSGEQFVPNQLWKSDGTAAGTVLLASFANGIVSGQPGNALEAVNGTLFFAANDGVHGDELWKSDGTAAGTVLVKDIYPGVTQYFQGGPVFLNNSNPTNLTAGGGELFFTVSSSATGETLWQSDGSAAGTVPVSNASSPGPVLSPNGLTDVNGTLYFAGADSLHGLELWKVDKSVGTLLASGQPVQAREGQGFTGVVATFTDSNLAAAASYTATITWGDGHVSPGTVTATNNGSFTITGSHTFALAGSYPVSIRILKAGGGSVTTTSTATVAGAPFYVNRTFFRASTFRPITLGVASFVSTNPDARASQFTATINWGDSQTSTGTVAPNGKGGFVVLGSHTYLQAGSYTVGVTVTEASGRTVSVNTLATVAAAPVLDPPKTTL